MIMINNNVLEFISRPFINGYWFGSVDDAYDKLEGAYSIVFVDKLVDINDPYGFRLLVMGGVLVL